MLATQIDVFEETQVEDDSHVIMPGGIDLNSHEDIFNALFVKVNIVYVCVCVYRLSMYMCMCVCIISPSLPPLSPSSLPLPLSLPPSFPPSP